MAIPQKIRVLVVEDSIVVRMLLVQVLNSDPKTVVIGTATNGREAIQFLAEQTPDVILMDIEMPEMGGLETTRLIMETRPVPIIICCGSGNPRETITTFQLMEAGAVACVEKPLGKNHKNSEIVAAQLLETVKLMSEVKVVRRWPQMRRTAPATLAPIGSSPKPATDKIELIGIGASTGGPPAIQKILRGLPPDFPVPILIVQHISPGFVTGMCEWLQQTTGFPIHVGSYGMKPLPGHVYLAPDDMHMTINASRRIVFNKDENEYGLRPSVAHLFRSLAEVCGANAVGMLLTGMGKDGAIEMKLMKDRGAVTIAQDRETSVVHGMPGEAINLDAATHVLAVDRIAPALIALANRNSVIEEQS